MDWVELHSAISTPPSKNKPALDTIDAAYQAGVRYFDTAPLYGGGLSEIRLGKGFARYTRDAVVISSKVGWALGAPAAGRRGEH